MAAIPPLIDVLGWSAAALTLLAFSRNDLVAVADAPSPAGEPDTAAGAGQHIDSHGAAAEVSPAPKHRGNAAQ